MKMKILFFALITFFAITSATNAQTTERPRPAEWSKLVFGGRFMDRFLPMPTLGPLTRDTWGADNVLPRDIKNGIENRKWSYWGGNIKLGEDGKYHQFVCGWLESSPKGHATWPNSTVFNAVSDNSFGPYVVKDTIGKGHNPEVFRLSDGKYVIYVIGGYYIANGINGPWTYGKFDFLNRDRKLIEGNSNFTFVQREDGSYLMICRGGGQWFSKTGLSAYGQVTGTRFGADKKITPARAYPQRPGNFEDPVVWRDNIQYNLIVNDWLGRIAVYERSKDGVNWKVESGEAYLPGVSVHEDGTIENWFKYERLPLTAGRLLTILDPKPITAVTKTVRVKISAEPGFNPQKDIDLKSLQFGEPEAVNFGKGGKVLKTEKAGADLIVTFNAAGNKYPDDEFAAKMIGKTTKGKLLFGYARLPGVNFLEPILSPLLPVITANANGFNIAVEVQNFGQVESKMARVKVVYFKDNKETEVASCAVQGLNPFEKTTANMICKKLFDPGVEYVFAVIINPDSKSPVTLHGKLTPVK